jgi:hypothetical protein
MELALAAANAPPMKKQRVELDPAIVAASMDRGPVKLPENTQTQNVISPERAAFMRKAAKAGINVDYFPKNKTKP